MKKLLLTPSLILLTFSLIIPVGSANNLYLDTQEFILGTDGYYFETNIYPYGSKQILVAFTPKPEFQQITDMWIHYETKAERTNLENPASVTVNFKINTATFSTRILSERSLGDTQLSESQLLVVGEAIQIGVNVVELEWDSDVNADLLRVYRLRLFITYEYSIPEVEELETISSEEQAQSGFLQTIANLIQDFLNRFPGSAAVAGVLAPVNKMIIVGPFLILVGIAVISSIFAIKRKRAKKI